MRDRGVPTSPDRNVFSYEADLTGEVHRRVDHVDNRLKVPTIPQYDSTQFPDEAVPGQIVRDVNDMGALWVYGSDEAWHQIGGKKVDYLFLGGATVGVSSGGNDRAQFDPAYNRTNNAALWDFQFYSGLIGVIYPQKTGLYVAMYAISYVSPTGNFRKTTTINVESFPNTGPLTSPGVTSAWVQDSYDTVEGDQVGQAAGFLPDIVSTPGPASGIASGQIILGASHNNGGSVNVYAEMSIFRYEI